MVALSSSTFSENPHSRARSIASICTDTSRRKSLNRIEMRLSIYENRIGLDSFSRDPIGYDGSPYNLYEFCNGKSLVAIDPSGMWYVYCRAVRDYPFLRHCDLRRECSPGEAIGPTGQTEIISCYPVQKSPSCRRGLGVPTSNPNCPKTCCNATDQDIEDCLGAYPSDNGEGECGSNCQSNTAERLGRCCLDSSWTPDIYGEPGSNRCLKWKQAGNPITGTIKCARSGSMTSMGVFRNRLAQNGIRFVNESIIRKPGNRTGANVWFVLRGVPVGQA